MPSPNLNKIVQPKSQKLTLSATKLVTLLESFFVRKGQFSQQSLQPIYKTTLPRKIIKHLLIQSAISKLAIWSFTAFLQREHNRREHGTELLTES